LSSRFGDPRPPNAIARARAELTAAGAPLTDLTDSNPTHFGLGASAVLATVARAARQARTYDPEPRGPLAAREALAARYGGSPDDYWLTASTSEAYSWVFAVLTDPDDAVAIPAPGYPLLEPLAALAGISTGIYRWHYLHPHGWYVDTDELTRLVALPEVRALVLVNPGNPTGAYVDDAAATAAVEACADGDAALIADEVFGPFVLEGQPASLAGEERVVTFAFGGLSKALCAPQLKLAWLRLSGPADSLGPIRTALDEIADTYLSVSAPVALALPELMDLSDSVLARTRERLAANLVTAGEIFGREPYRVRRCEGGWTAIVDLPRYLGEDDLIISLMREAGLAVHPGWFYDLPDPSALMISLLPEPEAFATRCLRLRSAVERLVL
jgi:aspartate/methionine/tyrosine aminotransferase